MTARVSRCVLATATPLLGTWALANYAHAQVVERDVSFRSGDVTLHGTVLSPERSDRAPAIVLVHGAGVGRRDENRTVAEALAREGLVTLIYDKRTQGYSASPVGSRSYDLLADDAVAAVRMLRRRNGVDPTLVGLWGFSEGGWVAPLAASRSSEIAFVITVAGGGIGPAEQSAWATEGSLRRRGVTSEGTLRALAERSYRFLISAGLFPEGLYDPVPVLERVRQPVLAFWGSLDRIMPAAASARAMRQALERGGNRHYVLRLMPDAGHALYAVVEGRRTDTLAAGYIEAVASWIRDVAAGRPPGPAMDAFPPDERPTRPSVTDVHGFARWELQLAFFAAFHLGFGGYLVAAVIARLRRTRSRPMPGRRRARTVAVLGLITSWGVYAFMGYIAATSGQEVTTVVAGRPVGWLVLQLLALALLLTTGSLAAVWYRERHAVHRSEHIRLYLLLAGVALFVPWAFWWQLFSP